MNFYFNCNYKFSLYLVAIHIINLLSETLGVKLAINHKYD